MHVIIKDETLHPPCGGCGSDLHQKWANIAWRTREEGQAFLVRTQGESTEVILRNKAEGAVDNRNAIRIGFACSECGKTHVLQIVQHKGETRVEWEY